MIAHKLSILSEVLEIPDSFWTFEGHQFSEDAQQILLTILSEFVRLGRLSGQIEPNSGG
jgi:hypothetical protein